MNFVKHFLDRTTMYRLMMYFMLALLGWAIIASALGFLSYNPWEIALQTFLFVAVCRLCNEVVARILKVKQNPESAIITGLILSGIMGPLSLVEDWWVLLVVSGAAIVSKYVFVIRRSHIFNPAAFGAVVASLLGFSASWWIGNSVTLPLVLAGGLLIAHKIRRLHLVASFLLAYCALLAADLFFVRGADASGIGALLGNLFISSPLLFFSFVMLVEPLTSPQTRKGRGYFGAVTAVAAFMPQWLAIPIAFSLEHALLIGNIFARVISPDFRQSFALRRKETFSPDVRGFWFEPVRPFSFIPGQFLEYTLAHPLADARGVRRYFTIASAPHEKQVLIATRFSDPSSSFKKALGEMSIGDAITASKVAGEFVLPNDTKKKLVFIAGGIGITPFRSIVKDMLEKNEHRDIVLLYAAREERDLVFQDIFTEAERVGMRTVSVLSDTEHLPSGWSGRTGRLDAKVIEAELPDAKERIFYISGPAPMVKTISDMLLGMGIPRSQIHRDYFPGYGTEPES